MINEIKKEAQERMGKTLEALGHPSKIRTGRAHRRILDSVMVSITGPIRRCARVSQRHRGSSYPWPGRVRKRA